MIAVLFEAWPRPGQQQTYLDLAAGLRTPLSGIDGFVSVERFGSLTDPGKLLSLSFWRDAQAVQAWRRLEAHRRAQAAGRDAVFADYRLSVAAVTRQYGPVDRRQAPDDSRAAHG